MNTETGELKAIVGLARAMAALPRGELLHEMGHWYRVPIMALPKLRRMNRAQRRAWARDNKHLLIPIDLKAMTTVAPIKGSAHS